MKYNRFIIKNYKAIEYIEINLSRNVIPLIGVNESGKTSILQGILAFDKDKDNLLNGVHSNPKNKYKTRQEICELIAIVEIENEEEFNLIGEEVKLKMDNPLYAWLKNKVIHKSGISIKRNYNEGMLQKNYTLVNEDDNIINNPKIGILISTLIKRLPNILYFDDFSDRVPEEISFPINYSENETLPKSKDREWQEIIIEIFSRALNEEFSLTTFLKLNNGDDRDNNLSDVSDILNKEIIYEWQKLKSAFSNFSKEDENLKLSIKYNKNNNKHTFQFKVIDSENNGNNRNFDINQRSKGFQWFFNFIMKLKFNPKYKTHPENAIYLLDEPGSYLHASAQTELLRKLCQIGENNTIIYCTHSQYLLDPDIINIGAIKIVSKNDGLINLEDYGNSSITRSLGAFSALNDALHLKFGFHENILKKCILTEGIVDYYFFSMFFSFKGINVIPGAGCLHLKELISILISCSDKFVVVLDYDAEGNNAFNNYNYYYGDSFKNHVYQYDGVRNSKEIFALENILSDNDITKIKTTMNCEDIKNALILLYFADVKTKKEIINKLDDESKRNINIINIKISEYFK